MSSGAAPRRARRRVALVTLGCARNEVDSEELAGRLERDGWALVDGDEQASVVVVNTCGFIEAAKRESVETLLRAADAGAKVVAAGRLAERYGAEPAGALPEADAVLGFDDYADIGGRLDDVLRGRRHEPQAPRDRRSLLPVTPVDRPAARRRAPGHRPAGAPGATEYGKDLADELTAQRAEERIGSTVEVLVEEVGSGGVVKGRAGHQAPEVDGATRVRGDGLRVGDLVRAKVTASAGVDLTADAVEVVSRPKP